MKWACTMQRSRRSHAVQAFLRDHQPLFQGQNGLLEATMRDITSQLRDAVLNRLHALPQGSAEQRLQAIVGGNFDETQVSSAAMKALAGVLGQQYASADALSFTAGQQPPLAVESGERVSSRIAARTGTGSGLRLAALIDGLWLRAALSGKPLDKTRANSLTRHFITQHLPTD